MNIIKIDFFRGCVYIDSIPIGVDEGGALNDPVEKLCLPPSQTIQSKNLYRLSEKVSVCGQSADCVIEINGAKDLRVMFLFDLIIFFESNILESKILIAFEKKFNVEFKSNHPSNAFLESCKWGSAIFSYDAKQGDLSFEIKIQGVQHDH